MEATGDINATFYIAGTLMVFSGFLVSATWYLHNKELHKQRSRVSIALQ